jgi:hypothetical protein
MTAAAAGDEGDLVVANAIGVGAEHDFVSGQAREVRAQDGEALQHFFNDVFRAVDELFHNALLGMVRSTLLATVLGREKGTGTGRKKA